MSAVQRLLARAQTDLGEASLAAAIGVPVARLSEWMREDCVLTLRAARESVRELTRSGAGLALRRDGR